MTTDTEPIETTAVVVSETTVPPPPALFGTNEPTEVIAKATAVADALKDVLRKRGLIANIKGKEYVTLEGWTTLGAMLGVFPVNVWTRPVEVEGKCIGWEARVEARRGEMVVGAAEAECLCTEKSGPWKNADDYALRSMAQTRASSKALRIPLGFVVTLAGYSPTPAEEMTFAQDDGPERASDEQCATIALAIGKLRKEKPEQARATVAALQTSYPRAIASGIFMSKLLTKEQAAEVIEILRQHEGD